MPAVRTGPRLATGFVYLLLLAVCTVTAAYGGYVVGSRSRPTESSIATQKGDAVKTAVNRAIAAQQREDRAKRRHALRAFADFQRQRFASELQSKLDAQHISDGEAAARAYSRGLKAGTVKGETKAIRRLGDGAAEPPAAGTPSPG